MKLDDIKTRVKWPILGFPRAWS